MSDIIVFLFLIIEILSFGYYFGFSAYYLKFFLTSESSVNSVANSFFIRFDPWKSVAKKYLSCTSCLKFFYFLSVLIRDNPWQ